MAHHRSAAFLSPAGCSTKERKMVSQLRVLSVFQFCFFVPFLFICLFHIYTFIRRYRNEIKLNNANSLSSSARTNMLSRRILIVQIGMSAGPNVGAMALANDQANIEYSDWHRAYCVQVYRIGCMLYTLTKFFIYYFLLLRAEIVANPNSTALTPSLSPTLPLLRRLFLTLKSQFYPLTFEKLVYNCVYGVIPFTSAVGVLSYGIHNDDDLCVLHTPIPLVIVTAIMDLGMSGSFLVLFLIRLNEARKVYQRSRGFRMKGETRKIEVSGMQGGGTQVMKLHLPLPSISPIYVRGKKEEKQIETQTEADADTDADAPSPLGIQVSLVIPPPIDISTDSRTPTRTIDVHQDAVMPLLNQPLCSDDDAIAIVASSNINASASASASMVVETQSNVPSSSTARAGPTFLPQAKSASPTNTSVTGTSTSSPVSFTSKAASNTLVPSMTTSSVSTAASDTDIYYRLMKKHLMLTVCCMSCSLISLFMIGLDQLSNNSWISSAATISVAADLVVNVSAISYSTSAHHNKSRRGRAEANSEIVE